MGHRTLRVLARPLSSALAAALYDAEHLHNIPHSALVLGPYGRPPDLGPFGIVPLIVEDIGIARVFSLIQTLVLASEQHRAMVRKLIVVWQMEDLDNRWWVNMQHFLDLDRQKFKILRFVLYYRRNRKNEPSQDPVCARQLIRNQVKAIVQPQLSDDLRLLDLDVEPYHQWLDTDPTVTDTTGPSRNHLQWIASRIAEGRGHSK